MKKSILISCSLTVVLAIVFYVLGCSSPVKEEPKKEITSDIISDSLFLATAGSLAMNHPDQFNWEVFARVCAKASFQVPVPNTKDSTNNVIWETWADDELTYPASPDPNNPPQFPTSPQHKKKKLVSSKQHSFLSRLKRKKGVEFVEEGGSEEVRRNEFSFNYIIQNKLWYTEGLAENFSKGTAGGNYVPLSFPTGAIEVKARWTAIKESDKPNYHWNYDSSGTLYGLTALHIMTKAIPNWTWATWEWIDNKGRCDDMGCHDAFGVTPANVDPHPGATGKPSPDSTGTTYPAGALTPELLALFKKFGLSDEWNNYRLKGSQTDWIDPTGRTTLVGNSVTENGFVATSSCITCHANASFDASGTPNPSFGFTPSGQSQNGPVDSTIFWKNGKPILFQGDFVWGLANAQPVKKIASKK